MKPKTRKKSMFNRKKLEQDNKCMKKWPEKKANASSMKPACSKWNWRSWSSLND
jgi:hypothetical protein